MNERQNKRYTWAINRQIERLQVGLSQYPAMVDALQKFADGEDVPLQVVDRAIKSLMDLLTLPVVPCLSGKYTPPEFWRREPIARLITKCKARLKS